MSPEQATEELRRYSRAEAVAQRIEERIAEQALPSGHRLGTKESLRREFDVAAATFNESVRLLSSRGTIAVRPGVKGGIFVASPPALVRMGRKMLELSGDSVSVSDCLAMRNALEPLVTREAMRHRGPADVAELRHLVDEMTGAWQATAEAADPRDMSAYMTANWRLHRRIAEITPNQILRHTYVCLLEFVEIRLRGVTADGSPAGPAGGADGPAVHRELVEAIAGDDPGRLAVAVERHAALTVAGREGP